MTLALQALYFQESEGISAVTTTGNEGSPLAWVRDKDVNIMHLS